MLRYGIRISVSVITFVLGIALSSALSFAPSLAPSFLSPDAPRLSVYEREVLEANQRYIDAHINRDAAALDALLSEDFVIGGRYGRVTGKAQRLALLTDSDFSFIDINSTDTRVTAGENAGEVSGYAVLRGGYAGREYTGPPYRYVRRFERRDGRWQVVGVETSRGRGH